MILASGLGVPHPRLAWWDATFAAMVLAQLFMDARRPDVRDTVDGAARSDARTALFCYRPVDCIERKPVAPLVLLFATVAIAVVAVVEAARSWLLYNDMPANIGADLEAPSGYGKLRGGLLRPRATWPESTGLSLYYAVALTMLYACDSRWGCLASSCSPPCSRQGCSSPSRVSAS